MTPPAGPPGGRRQALHAVIRPRRSRQVAVGLAVAQGVVFGGLALIMPGTGPMAFGPVDRVSVIAVSVGIGWVLWRFATVRAVPAEDGLTVRNFLRTRSLEWAEIVAVRFGGGGPWVVLDLSDGDVLPVMAVQRSDGAFGVAEARRLATLAELHTRTERDG